MGKQLLPLSLTNECHLLLPTQSRPDPPDHFLVVAGSWALERVNALRGYRQTLNRFIWDRY
jgi:hypothetical protein